MHLDVVRELKASTEVKVLLAVDSYNEFFQPSMWHYMDDKVCVIFVVGRNASLSDSRHSITCHGVVRCERVPIGLSCSSLPFVVVLAFCRTWLTLTVH